MDSPANDCPFVGAPLEQRRHISKKSSSSASTNFSATTASSMTLHSTPTRIPIASIDPSSSHSEAASVPPLRSRFERFKFKEDYRARLPSCLSRYTGYRPHGDIPPYEPVYLLSWLHKIPLQWEVWIFAWVGAFINTLLIEAIMSSNTAFRSIFHTPTIITSFGASAVLVFAVIESPLAQPRNLVVGHTVSALVATAITRLFVLNPAYVGYLENNSFHAATYLNGGLSMATALLVQLVFGIAHPPAGATALTAAVDPVIVNLSWHLVPTVLSSCLIMTGWALFVNNLGRRRYPMYWVCPESIFVVASPATPANVMEEQQMRRLEEGILRKAEDGGRTPEALFMEQLEGDSGYTTEEVAKE